MKNIALFLSAICALVALSFTGANAAQIHIAAAASLTSVIKANISAYKKTHPAVEILPNFASSGALVRQLTNGAPADIYISANPKWMAYLEDNKGVIAHTKAPLVQNSLVFAGLPAEGVTGMESLISLERISMCNPSSSPAGRYAEQALKASGIYTQLERENRLIFAKDVRQALLYAERGEVDGAFVYRTDALLAQHTEILFQVDHSLHPQIVYPAAMTPSGTQNPAALEFFDFLKQESARTIFRNYGFIIPADSGN